MNRLSLERRAQVVQLLVDGRSIRGSARETEVAKNTVVKLVTDLGRACLAYQDRTLRNLHGTRFTCKEILVSEETWVWVALCADTKLVPSWLIGSRSVTDAYAFVSDLKSRLRHPELLTVTDDRSVKVSLTGGGIVGLNTDRDACALAMHYAYYNFCRPHSVLGRAAGTRTTPAMAAHVTDYVWTIEELCDLQDSPWLLTDAS